MIDCTQYRRTVLADPRDPDPALRAHREGCDVCTAYTERLMRFEARLGAALRIEVPERGRAWRSRRGWLAMAASVLVVLFVAGGLWLAAPHPSLAADVVAHMGGEPQAWVRTDVPVPEPELQSVLDGAHMQLRPSAGLVSYAQSCEFRGARVPHLVVQTDAGPITVMVLRQASVRSPQPFDEGGYRGIIVPVPGRGSLAVLARGNGVELGDIEQVAARVQQAIVWTN
jgi:hypothetical protein